MPEVPADFCLECGYRLTGLPSRHRCPECGTPYDEHIRVWKPVKPGMHYVGRIIGIIGFAITAFNLLFVMPTLMPVTQMIRWGLLVFLVPLGIFYVNWFRWARRRGPRITFTSIGVTVRTVETELVVPWLNAVSVEPVNNHAFRSTVTARIIRANSPEIVIIGYFRSAAELANFDRAFRNSRRAYLAEAHRSAPASSGAREPEPAGADPIPIGPDS